VTTIVLDNLHLAPMTSPTGYGLVEDAMVVVESGRIRWAGARTASPVLGSGATRVDCEGRLATPGLIDCHTHLVHGGNRAVEFEQRLEGVSYTEIARSGGGIMSTVKATRAADDDTLFAESLPRLRRILDEGVTTVEIKSGYGLDTRNEIKMLRVARKLGVNQKVRVSKTFLGAHTVPEEYADRADDYIDTVCEEMLPAAVDAGLVDAVDAFCEGIAFTPAQVARVFDAAISLGLPIKCHAEQLSDLGGAVMSARRGALSVDHLEYLKQNDVEVLAKHGTVAVLLPGAFYVLRETQLPPLDALRSHKVPIAVSTDCNPGSSPLTSLLLAMNMACTLFRMTPFETLAGVTTHAARALGLAREIGTIEKGKIADIALWDVNHPAELSVNLGLNPCAGVMSAGLWRDTPYFVH
jgi:imidazolonepropionase